MIQDNPVVSMEKELRWQKTWWVSTSGLFYAGDWVNLT